MDNTNKCAPNVVKKIYRNSNNMDGDRFVGVKLIDGEVSVHFPMGFHLNVEDENEIRKDILLLLKTIQYFAKEKNQSKGLHFNKDDIIGGELPIISYQYLILDYMSNGFYVEKEDYFTGSDLGKISWKRTIRNIKPVLNNGNISYLEFIVKKNRSTEDNIMRKIHEYCVYISFNRLGWLYTASMPPKVNIKFNKRIFSQVLNEEINKTFDDRKIELFQAMLAVVNTHNENSYETEKFICGVKRFEYIWESMIDNIYGIDKEEMKKYQPKARWFIKGSTENGKEKSPLRPDTIMKIKKCIYILDAKYYKYGITQKEESGLPGTDSIQKQITYAEYLLSDIFKEIGTDEVECKKIYNSFLMPYDDFKGDGSPITTSYIGYATADWKNKNETYEKVHGILVDVKGLMQQSMYGEQERYKLEMAELINMHVNHH